MNLLVRVMFYRLLELGNTIAVVYEVYRVTIIYYGNPGGATRHPALGIIVILGTYIATIIQVRFAPAYFPFRNLTASISSTVTVCIPSSPSRTISWDYSLASLPSEGPLSSPTLACWKSRQPCMRQISKRCTIE